jgi:hypothetical protein
MLHAWTRPRESVNVIVWGLGRNEGQREWPERNPVREPL